MYSCAFMRVLSQVNGYWFITGHAFVCAGVKNCKADSDSSNGMDNGSASSKISLASVLPAPRSEVEIWQSSHLKSFSFAELKEATRNFCPVNVLGEPASGSVFKGWIDEHSLTATKPGTGLAIAVKRLNQDSFRGDGEWLVSYLFEMTRCRTNCFLLHIGFL